VIDDDVREEYWEKIRSRPESKELKTSEGYSKY
jgi:hypothetical protein